MSIAAPFRLPRTGRVLRNRTVLAAMTNKQSAEDGTLSAAEIRWLARRAAGGFGIVTTAATHVTPGGKSWSGEMGVWSDHHLPGLTELASAIRAEGAVSLAQIFHGGRRAPRECTGQQPVSASDVPADERTEAARGLTEPEVEALVDAFVEAAIRCARAGLDGVELHGAHGYLISQFLGTKTNRRTDRWGGDVPGRARFLQAIIAGIRAATAPDFLIAVRLSPVLPDVGITLADSEALVPLVASWDIDLLHVSCWDVTIRAEDDQQTFTRRFRDALPEPIPLISTGGVWSQSDVDFTLAEGADLVGVARAGIGHPDWPRQLVSGNPEPTRPPFTPEHLATADLSPPFIDYMRRWKGFVTDGKA